MTDGLKRACDENAAGGQGACCEPHSGGPGAIFFEAFAFLVSKYA